MSSNNPYAAPQVPVASVQATQTTLATQGQRFANLIVDTIVTQILSFIAGLVIGIAFVVINGPEASAESAAFQVFSALSGIVVVLGYYFVMEAACGRTVGKFVTGTRVVSVAGGPATFGQVLGRTLCRLIPFEAFSFFMKDAVGWHDSIPNTRVVKAR